MRFLGGFIGFIVCFRQKKLKLDFRGQGWVLFVDLFMGFEVGLLNKCEHGFWCACKLLSNDKMWF